MNKTLTWVLVILVIIVVAYVVSVMTTGSPVPSSQEAPSTAEMSAVVSFNGSSFVPAAVTIKRGGVVTFRNDSTGPVWPASAQHPTHREYPTTGGCIGSTFDACRELAPGESWSFTFDIAGTWKYHDHVGPSSFGTVMVTP